MLDASIFAARRQRYMDQLGPNAVAVIHSQPETLRNGDVHNPFRQTSDIHYLTGFIEPETTLVLRPGAETDRFVMFVRPRDKERETWDGRRAGLEGAMQRYGADASYAADEVETKLWELIANAEELHYSLGVDSAFDEVVTAALARLRRSEKRGRRAPRAVVDPHRVLHELRLHKTSEEVEILRKAAAITAEAHLAAMKKAAPGVHEYELEALVNYTFRARGGGGPGYGTIVGSGANATILHYVENDQPMAAGDLVLIDAGCEYSFYTADVTRTFPCDGTFTAPQRAIYQAVLRAQKAAVAMTKPGITLDALHDECIRIMTEALVDLGILEGPVSERIEAGDFKRFYMHGTSHWLGMDVHDVGPYALDGASRPLEPGMVITIEPGLYFAIDDDTVPAPYRGIGIRIEDDVLVTEAGHENLTAAIPKEIDDVEAACRSN